MKFNDAFLKVYPMKAQGIKKDKIPWEDTNYIWEEKFDGDRRLLWITSEKNYNTSRNSSVEDGNPTQKTDNVPHLRDLKLPGLEGTTLDGEFDHPLGMDEGVRKIMGCLPDKAVERQKKIGKIIFKVYDIIFYKGEWVGDLDLIERKKILKEIFETTPEIQNNPYIIFTESYPGGDKEFLEKKLEEILAKPFGEGMVAKHKKSKYRLLLDKSMPCLKKGWIKVKKGFNGDFVVMGYEDPEIEYTGKTDLNTWPYWIDENNNLKYMAPYVSREGLRPITKYYGENWIGAIIFGEYQNGILTKVGTVSSGLNEELRAEISKNPSLYLNKVIEINAFERVKKTNALKQPVFKRFRNDKLPEDCIYENQEG